jgi:hypothetical protein
VVVVVVVVMVVISSVAFCPVRMGDLKTETLRLTRLVLTGLLSDNLVVTEAKDSPAVLDLLVR